MKAETSYGLATGLVLLTGAVIVFLNAAAGMLGIEDDDPANLLYGVVLAIGFFGAVAARLRPRGMSAASLATALAQALVGAFALTYPNTASPTQILIVHSLLSISFGAAAVLYRDAARAGVPAHPSALQ